MSDDILHTGRADIHHPASPEPIIQEWEIEELGPHLPSQAKFKRKVAIFTEDGLVARDARVRAAALRDFAASMRALAEQAPEGEPATWPWTAYALAAVKAEERAAAPAERVRDGSTDTTGTQEHAEPEEDQWAPA